MGAEPSTRRIGGGQMLESQRSSEHGDSGQHKPTGIAGLPMIDAESLFIR
jgi:hypothetical protein